MSSGFGGWVILVAMAACDPMSYGHGGSDGSVTPVNDTTPPTDITGEPGPSDAPPGDVMGEPGPQPDAMSVPGVDSGVDGGVGPSDGGPGDAPDDAPGGPGNPGGPGPNGSRGDEIQSFYACSTGAGGQALPLAVAFSLLALRRRRR